MKKVMESHGIFVGKFCMNPAQSTNQRCMERTKSNFNNDTCSLMYLVNSIDKYNF